MYLQNTFEKYLYLVSCILKILLKSILQKPIFHLNFFEHFIQKYGPKLIRILILLITELWIQLLNGQNILLNTMTIKNYYQDITAKYAVFEYYWLTKNHRQGLYTNPFLIFHFLHFINLNIYTPKSQSLKFHTLITMLMLSCNSTINPPTRCTELNFKQLI